MTLVIWEWGTTGQMSLAKKAKENVKGVSLNVTKSMGGN